ncbi:MAG: hypothetical protein V1755_01525 [Chloroflexota bacterium]
MKKTPFLALLTALFAILACGLPGPAPEATAPPLPATPAFLPTQSVPSPAPAATSAPAAANLAGTWKGPDPDDGSSMTLTLVQSGNALSGTYTDSYSGNIAPPGYEGTVSGTVLSSTTGQIALDLRRHDGSTIVVRANLMASDQDTITATVTSQGGVGQWVLKRQ